MNRAAGGRGRHSAAAVRKGSRLAGFLVIGESVADIVRAPGAADSVHPGGSPANVAVGLARLGYPTALLTQLGVDQAGQLIVAHLHSAGVRVLSDGQRVPATPTAVVSLDEAGQAEYAFDIHWTLRDTALDLQPQHVHAGSLGAVLEPGAAATLRTLRRARSSASVSYDPNVRPGITGDRATTVSRVERGIQLSDLVKASADDLAWLYPDEPLDAVAARWLALGPALVLVTRGAEGATALGRAGSVTVPAVPVAVADTVGAGDAFTAAVLDWLAGANLLGARSRPVLRRLDPEALARLLDHAVRAAAITVSRAGADPPNRVELNRPELTQRR